MTAPADDFVGQLMDTPRRQAALVDELIAPARGELHE